MHTLTLLSLHLLQPVLDFPRDRRWWRGSPCASTSGSERLASNSGSLKHWNRAFRSDPLAISCVPYHDITAMWCKAMLELKGAWASQRPLKSNTALRFRRQIGSSVPRLRLCAPVIKAGRSLRAAFYFPWGVSKAEMECWTGEKPVREIFSVMLSVLCCREMLTC
jgi:hypothetical protein